MRHAWSNLVLHTTSYIFQKKQDVLLRHGWRSVLDVWAFLGAKIFLFILAFPVAVLMKPIAKGWGGHTYTVRTRLARSAIIVFGLLWCFKVVLWGVGVWLDSNATIVQDIRSSTAFDPFASTITQFTATEVSPSLASPTITTISERMSGTTFSGSGVPGSTAVLFLLHDVPPSGVVVLSAAVNEDGTYTVSEDRAHVTYATHVYDLQAFTLDAPNGVRSMGSDIVRATIHRDDMDVFLSRVDRVLNVLVLIALAISISLHLLIA